MNSDIRISGQKQNAKQDKILRSSSRWKHFFQTSSSYYQLKLNRANCLLSKIRYYVRASLLRTIFIAIVDLQLRYECQIWGQDKNVVVENFEIMQNKAIRAQNLKDPSAEASDLCKE